jgi:hypothetical protein
MIEGPRALPADDAVEPRVSAEALARAVPPDLVETLRPLLPVGYAAGAAAYRRAVEGLDADALSTHYTRGLAFFSDELAPRVKALLSALSLGEWALDDFVAYAAGSDVDLMAHIVEAAAARGPVRLYPGDWYGFLVGATLTENIRFDADSGGALACLCVPSVRNGHLTEEMAAFLSRAEACLLNINLFPTLPEEERRRVAARLRDILPKSILSVSFSRGFGLTASQLGVALVHRDHPLHRRFSSQWAWFTYFYNAIAARAFMALSPEALAGVDEARRRHVAAWLSGRSLPPLATGSYYVKTFRLDGEPPAHLSPLLRDGRVRLCMKPPQT